MSFEFCVLFGKPSPNSPFASKIIKYCLILNSRCSQTLIFFYIFDLWEICFYVLYKVENWLHCFCFCFCFWYVDSIVPNHLLKSSSFSGHIKKKKKTCMTYQITIDMCLSVSGYSVFFRSQLSVDVLVPSCLNCCVFGLRYLHLTVHDWFSRNRLWDGQ